MRYGVKRLARDKVPGMNRATLRRTFRKLRTSKAWSRILLFAVFPVTGQAQNAPAKSPANAPATLQTMAQDLSQQLASHPNLIVTVLDFAAPDKRSFPFGAYLADQFAAELARVPSTLAVTDRAKLLSALTSLKLTPEAELDHANYRALEIAVDAQCVVEASYGELKGGLGITLLTDCPDALHVPHTPINRRVEFSPKMAANLGAPLESLRPSGGAQDSGTAGLTWPACTHCPPASFTHEAEVAKMEGTVWITAVITPEGRAVDIQVTKTVGAGLDQSAVHAVAKWKFRPAVDPDGNPTSVRQTIEVTFHLD
jgi:TonB family protein